MKGAVPVRRIVENMDAGADLMAQGVQRLLGESRQAVSDRELEMTCWPAKAPAKIKSQMGF